MTTNADITIIGGGVIGLAIARTLASPDKQIFILEQEKQFGAGISSRNSEVIHAGIYYSSDSLKAKLCVSGKEQLYRYCQQRDIPHKKTGKLIVAQHAGEITALQTIEKQAHQNGVNDLRWWDKEKLLIEEPQIKADLALLSPSTGIIDSHALMQSLLADAESNGAQLVCHCKATRIQAMKNGFQIHVDSNGEPYQFYSRAVINAAGLEAPLLAHTIEGLEKHLIPALYYCKGSYFSYSAPPPFKHLIYPVPEANNQGLGIHATLDLSGQIRFGPDTEYISTEDYPVNPLLREKFAQAIQRYFPTLQAEKLSSAYAGIRPKLAAPNSPAQDFQIQSAQQHGLAGLIQLFGIESPGLTASLAIAKQVADTLHEETN